MKIQNTKTKIATIMTSIVIGLMLISATTVPHNADAVQISHHIGYAPPTLTSSTNQAIINAALTIPELQNWSHDWKYVDMAFLGNNKVGTPDFQWQYAIVTLKAPSSSAAISCNGDWNAWIEVDMTTMNIVRAVYPTLQSHPCDFTTTGTGPHHAFSTTTEDDVNSTKNKYYGNYAELNLPTFGTNIYHDLNGSYLSHMVNIMFKNNTVGCLVKRIGATGCLEQGGWQVTNGTFYCTGCPAGPGKSIIYTDESKQDNENSVYSGLHWGTATTLYVENDCAYTSPDYGITISNGTNMVSKTTSVACTNTQWNTSPPRNGVMNNSVFFENAGNFASSHWSGDVGTVSATNAQEYLNSTLNSALVSWTGSHKVDTTCSGVDSNSQVITGSLAGGTTATWSSLNNVPKAC
jgi:hypothetical protein